MSAEFVEECVSVLERTPATLDALLRDLPAVWTGATDGPGTWSAYDVVGHLIHGERADWLVRLAIILEHGPYQPFEPFDREAQFRESHGKNLSMLLDEFGELRRANLARLRALDLQAAHLELEGAHPAFGRVTVRQLLATWTAHDMGHIVQVSRTMARRYKQDVGPWAAYLSVVQ
ncbi:MAG TPA: DinB family protein [Bryobacteraceae bacterium]|nr:DinB family protein [Bryobacteraceae bacterium]